MSNGMPQRALLLGQSAEPKFHTEPVPITGGTTIPLNTPTGPVFITVGGTPLLLDIATKIMAGLGWVHDEADAKKLADVAMQRAEALALAYQARAHQAKPEAQA